jgi:hypothetical protein
MFRKALLFACLAGLAVGATGCTYYRDHTRRHWEAWKQDMHQFHKDFDRLILNYDETDPNRY